MTSFIFLYIFWNPSREAFTVPLLDRPVAWYGLFFALGFLAAYAIVRKILEKRVEGESLQVRKEKAASLADKLTIYLVIATIVGARLGEVLFYGLEYYIKHPLDIFKIWEGGLASHGGAIGILIAVMLFRLRIKKNFPYFTTLKILDTLAIACGVACACIRIGNFFNQEILGYPTDLPWAITFGNPWNGEAAIPRHPVQLYEAIIYLLTCVILLTIWKFRGSTLKDGFYTGLFFILVFGSRFMIEWLKLPQTLSQQELGILSTGQYLSLPFIFAGIYLLIRRSKPSRCHLECNRRNKTLST